MQTFDQEGNNLSALPADAVKINSSLIMLSGKYVDSDGIVYDPSGVVNEPATAAYAREIAMGRIAMPYYDYTTPEAKQETKQESIQERSDFEAAQSSVDSFLDNIFYTAQDVVDRSVAIPGQVIEEAKKREHYIYWIIAGLVAYAVIKVADRIPSQGHVKRYAKKKIGEARRRVARRMAGA